MTKAFSVFQCIFSSFFGPTCGNGKASLLESVTLALCESTASQINKASVLESVTLALCE